ncbi:gamma-interferon-inducible lysosomal thiol reductase-like isoform X3 [Phalaenopsis equestris]|uniref:gamma-interferon-inducible lysosomal thiol reductase-like isoform X3 n=1 Tax=Phalaenopsis equestris TaxID=78828 RepID=UPI0009E19A9E|nr:gamma-interferon-inducible lysosomal thiol reductase-like isoform X3 [Phalaenopsis equestris]
MAPVHRTLLLLFFASAFFLPLSTTSATQKVSLALYYEALCPFCSRFIVLSLSKIFSDGLISIVDLRLVPYGNAVIGPNSTIICQHGPSECFLNTVEACAINSWSDVQKHFSFIYCVENLVIANKYSDWESCFQRTGLDPHPLVNCYNSGHGQEDYDNFEKYICKAYRGELPSACRRLPVYLAQQMRPNGAERSSTAGPHRSLCTPTPPTLVLPVSCRNRSSTSRPLPPALSVGCRRLQSPAGHRQANELSL